ncbi:MAG: R3H domain-containing nucleic acid-binding protein [Candidatus Levyibacteriota bacterium]
MAKTNQPTGGEKEIIVKEVTSEILKLLEIEGTFETLSSKESNDQEQVEVILDTKESGIIIGYHGETLEALQLILSLCVSKKLGHFVRVSVEVGDYKKNRMEFLKNLALEAKERVISENKEFSLSNLKSWERRIVHLILQDFKEVMTESVGEGKDRALVIKPQE